MIVAISENLRVLVDVLANILCETINHFLRDVDVELDHDRLVGRLHRNAPEASAEPSTTTTPAIARRFRMRGLCARRAGLVKFALFMAFPRFRGAE
jgi:hypothetical protein